MAASADGDEEEGDKDEEDEEDEIAEWIADDHQKDVYSQIMKTSFLMMGTGTIIVLFFSDAMVNILNELGVRTGIPPFFVAFILAPIASNASELIASISYASRKEEVGTEVAFGQLLGAACMNNTFVLGIFLALLCFRDGLVWTFTAETIIIIIIEIIMAIYALRRVHKYYDAFIVMSLFPLSIVLVWVLEYPVKLN